MALFAIFSLFSIYRYAITRTNQHELEHEQMLGLPPTLQLLKSQLRGYQLEPALKSSADLALTQLQIIESGLHQGSELLLSKLDPGELTFSRFRNGLQAGAESIAAQVKDATDCLQQASSLGSREQSSEPARSRAAALLESSQNGIGAFSSAIAELVNMKTDGTRTELPEAVRTLEQIAERAKNMSIKSGDSNG